MNKSRKVDSRIKLTYSKSNKDLKIINIIIIKYLFVIIFPSDNLQYMFLDESGDLGFKKTSSSHFIVSIICTERPKPLFNCIKRQKAKLSKKHNVHIREIKNVPPTVDIKVLKCISNKDLSIHYMSLDKTHIPRSLQKKNVIQAHMIGKLVNDVVQTLQTKEKINLVIDKFLPTSKITPFNSYITDKMDSKQIVIDHPDSASNNGIQAAHIVAKGINKLYRDGDSSYYDIISRRIGIKHDSAKITL
jgi:hypothetical protein